MEVCDVWALLLCAFDAFGLYFTPLAHFRATVLAQICLGNSSQWLRQFDAIQLLAVVHVAPLTELLSFGSLWLALIGLIHAC